MINGKSIKLHIKSAQDDGGGTTDATEFYTQGRYYEKDGNRYLSYEESEVSGMEGTTTVLELGAGEAALKRSGAINSDMMFRPGCEIQSIYATAFGDIDLSVLTEKLDIKNCNGLIDSVYLKYRLRVGLNEAYTTEMTIRVTY